MAWEQIPTNDDETSGVLFYWPEGDGDFIPAQAIKLESLSHVLEIKQGGNEINIGWSDVPEFIRLVRQFTRDFGEGK